MKRTVLLLLILCNLVWSVNPLMGKILLSSFNGVQVGWIRYASAFLSFAGVALLSVLFFRKRWSDFFFVPKTLRAALELTILGTGPFVFAPIMQFVGLESSQAMDNSILLAMEPLLTVVLAWSVLGEKMNRHQAVAMGWALIGFLLFSGFLGRSPETPLSFGMFLLFFAQIGEAGYSVFGRKLSQEFAPTAVLGSALAIGALGLSLFVWRFDSFPDLSALREPRALLGAFWLGPLGSTVTYLAWMVILRSVTVPAMAVTLFIQPIFGAFLSYCLLGERLTSVRTIGAVLILAAIAYSAAREVVSVREGE